MEFASVSFTGGSLKFWLETYSTSTQSSVLFTPKVSAANVNAVIAPKGAGSLLVRTPDGTATGGNARGTYAVDLQHARAAAAQVASGTFSVVSGGGNNTASNDFSSVGGGISNTASGIQSTVGGGNTNSAVQAYHTIGGGYFNSTNASGDGQTIGGGGLNSTGGTWSTIGGGSSNLANGNYTTVSGGFDATIQSAASYSFIGGGNTNTITAGASCVIVGGTTNTINTSAAGLSCIVGGISNSITGTYNFIGGGDTNISGGSYGVIVGGQQNSTNSLYQFIGGGFSNAASGNGNIIVGGYDNSSTGSYSFVGGGEQNNHANGAYGFIGGGQTNFLNSDWGVICGGLSNTINSVNATIVGGRQASATLLCENAYSSGRFASNGDAQMATIQMRRAITGTTITELFLDGSSVRAILPTTNTLWMARIQIVAICTAAGNGTTVTGDSYVTERHVGIKRLNTATSLVGSVQTIGTAQADATMSTSVVTITADDTNEALKVEFTPPSTAGSTTTFRVVATIQLTQVKY
jgi:hypothetical protein